MAIADILSALITKEGTLTGNPVAPFAYSSTAFANDDADGHSDYNVARENNIPTADPDVLDVNGTVLAKGFRSQASSLTRMLMNHFFGRASYNLNKTVEVMNSLLAGLSSALGANNGIATLDSSGKLSSSQIPGEIVTSVNGVSASNNTVDITGEDINVSSSSSTKVNTALATLQSNIEAEATARRSTDTTLQSDIDDLETADQTLQTNIDTVSANLASEVSARETQYKFLKRLASKMYRGTATYKKSGSSGAGYTYVYTLTVTIDDFNSSLDYFVDTPLGSAVLSMSDGSFVHSTASELYPKNLGSKIASSSFDSSTNKLTLVSTSLSSGSDPWSSDVVMPVVFTKFYN